MPTFTSTTLPHLDTEELSTVFGNDMAARRRYQALSALLHQGKTQREAAVVAQMSERTVRNTLRAFSRRGVAGLRSAQQGAKRRTGARKLFEQALRSALRAEPDAGGDRLWRRALDLLGPDAPALSRRTAYRILADLRAGEEEGEQESDELIGKLRAALPQLHEDPPLALGASSLAQFLLPGEGDALSRGLLLQTALRAAMDRLRPDGPVSAVDRGWWPYLICSGEYEAGQRRSELQQSLSLSPSTYSRAKRSGLARIVALLPALIAQANVRSQPQRLPRVAEFVGRAQQQAFYSAQLISSGVALIWGVACSGKTALAAEIAAEGRRYGQRVIWHSCQSTADATLRGILRGLARSLAACGDDSLVESAFDPEATSEADDAHLLVLLSQRLLRQPTLIVLDDMHRCAADPAVAPLLDELRALAMRRAVRLLLVGRDRITNLPCPPLDGLSASEASALWDSIGGPTLNPDRWDEVFQASAGLPGLLPLVGHHADEYGLRGSWHDELESWAHVELWDRLDATQERVLALLLADGRPLPLDPSPLLAALDASAAVLGTLEDRGLLLRTEHGLQPHPALRLAMPALSLPHWEQLQAAFAALGPQPAALPESLAKVPEGFGSPIAQMPQLATRPVSAEVLARTAEVLRLCATSCTAHNGVVPEELLQLASQLSLHL